MFESATSPVGGVSASSKAAPQVSLVVPVFNEVKNLPDFLKALDALELGYTKELIIVDDCSHDGSHVLIESFEFKSPYTCIRQPKNLGKGAAVRAGIAAATGEIIGIQDADFEYDIHEIGKVIAPLIRGEADVVYGSRFLESGFLEHRSYHYLGNRALTLFSNLLSGLHLSDMETCYKFFRREIIQNLMLESERFGFEPEVTAKLARLNLRLKEVPVSYEPRSYGQGKKITWKDGVAALWHIVRFNLLVNHQDAQSRVPDRYQKS